MNQTADLTKMFEGMMTTVVEAHFKEQVDAFNRRVDTALSQIGSARPVSVTAHGKPTITLEESRHVIFEDLLACLTSDEVCLHNLALVGPAGSGKTHIGSQLARALQVPFFFESATAGLSEAKLIGTKWADGKFYPGTFLRGFESTEGAVILLDDADRMDSNAAACLHAALSNGMLPVTKRDAKPEATRAKNVYIIASLNTFGDGANLMYTSAEQQDTAFLNRFEFRPMDYDKTLESSIITNMMQRYDKGTDAPELLNRYWDLRKGVEDNNLRRCVSTRDIMRAAAKRGALSWSVDQCVANTTLPWTEHERSLVKGVA